MRKRLLLALAIVGLSGGIPTMVRADGPSPAPAAQRKEVSRPVAEIDRLKEAVASLQLTDDQRTKVDEIFKTAKEKVEAWWAANKDAMTQLEADAKAARESGDPAKIEAVKTKRQELLKDAPKPRAVAEQLKTVLTPEQQDKLKQTLQSGKGGGSNEALRPIARLRAALACLNLTADQKAKIKDIFSAAEQKVKDFRAANKDAFEKAEQDMKAAKQAGDPDKIAAARHQYETLMKDALNTKDLAGQINAVLTAEQQEKFQARLKAVDEKRPGAPNGPKPEAPAAIK